MINLKKINLKQKKQVSGNEELELFSTLYLLKKIVIETVSNVSL